MGDEGFHEIQLSGKHLVALFMAATVVAVVIFLCGVMVGRDVQKQRFAMAASASEPSADPTAQVRTSGAPEPSRDAGPASPPAAGAGEENLTYPNRLSGNNPPAESLKPAPAAPAAERSPRPPPEPSTSSTAAGTAPAAEPSGTGFAVQVAAVAERGEADTIARRLSTKGYPAYVMSPVAGAPRVFRVRVGKYKERREAEHVADRLRREEQFKPWITR